MLLYPRFNPQPKSLNQLNLWLAVALFLSQPFLFIFSRKPDTGREGGDRRSVVHGRDDRRDSRASPSSTTTDQRDLQLRNVFGVDRREDDRRGQAYVAGRGFGGGDRRGGAGGDRRSSYGHDDRRK